MKTITQLFCFVVALLSLSVSPKARADCREGCDHAHANTFLGEDALFSLTSGADNTAIGFEALHDTTIALYNTALGYKALTSNSTGGGNTASGVLALASNTIGGDNTAAGYQALTSNVTGNSNTAVGLYTLYSNTVGSSNTASGASALSGNISGSNNTAVGANALGHTTGSNNIGLGDAAGLFTTGDDNIYIGNKGRAHDSSTIRIGSASQSNAYVAGINGVTVAGGVGVIVDASGHLGTTTSSARLKEAIRPMAKTSEAILALHPVTFRYKHDVDPDGMPQFGLVAEEVEKVNPDLVARDEQGKPYTVRYEAVNAMLLNEFLKAHRKMEQQGATIGQLQKQVAKLTADLQEVSTQLEVMKPMPQTASR